MVQITMLEGMIRYLKKKKKKKKHSRRFAGREACFLLLPFFIFFVPIRQTQTKAPV